MLTKFRPEVSAALVLGTCAAVLLVLERVAFGQPAYTFWLLVIALGSAVVAVRPRVLAYATIVLAFTAFPSAVPQTINLHGTGILIYEPTLVAAAVYEVMAGHVPRAARRSALILGLLATWLCFVGHSSGASVHELIVDGRGMVDGALAVLVGGALVTADRQAGALRVVKLVLWVSAGFTLAASLGALTLQGTSQVASLDTVEAAADTATRLLTPATAFGFAACAVVLALYLTRRASLRQMMPFLIPALTITILAFSRNHLLGLAAVAVAAVLLDRSAGAFTSVLPRLAGAAAVGFLIVVLASSNSGYIHEQVVDFRSRVVEGISGKARAADPSALYRKGEDRQLQTGIREDPVLGHGFGVPYQAPQGDADSFTATTGIYYAHNYYLWLWFKGGLLALAAWGAAVVLPLLRLWRIRTSVAVSSGATLAGFLAISVFAPQPNDIPGAVLFGAVVGVVAAAGSVRSGPVSERDMATAPELVPLQ